MNKTIPFSSYYDMTPDEFKEYWKAYKQTLREKSGVRVSFLVKFHPDNGEIVSVIPNCDIPCQCEECAFKKICSNIKNRIISGKNKKRPKRTK